MLFNHIVKAVFLNQLKLIKMWMLCVLYVSTDPHFLINRDYTEKKSRFFSEQHFYLCIVWCMMNLKSPNPKWRRNIWNWSVNSLFLRSGDFWLKLYAFTVCPYCMFLQCHVKIAQLVWNNHLFLLVQQCFLGILGSQKKHICLSTVHVIIQLPSLKQAFLK